MEFKELLNYYLEQLSASQRELASCSGLSAATISRYCSGEREPESGSAQVQQLAQAIAELAARKEDSPDMIIGDDDSRYGTEDVAAAIAAALNDTLRTGINVEYKVFLNNLTSLLSVLDVRSSELARALSYDPSHISRILSGSRRPGNLRKFIDDTATYLARRSAGDTESETLASLLGTDPGELQTAAALKDQLLMWLGSNPSVSSEEPVSRFLEKLDDFDLNEYMKAIRFDEMKLPPAIPQLATSKTYYGIARMMESELDFMKATVLSKSMADVILYSDMPLKEMASDPDFPKKWMFGMGMMLKKGLHLHFIHDVNRPFAEMMLGLEGNIPMYMTGQISPYYLPASQGTVFNHLLKVSGAAALEGNAISGKQGEGKYVLYRSREDLRHYRKRAEDLLGKASPLMDIYREDRKSAYHAKLKSYWAKYDCRVVCSSLPFYTMSSGLLAKILAESGTDKKQSDEILRFHAEAQKAFMSHLEKYNVSLVIAELSEEQFAASPLNLSLPELFIEKDIPYTFEDYSAHLEEVRRMAEENPRLVLELNPSPAFHNLTFTVFGDKAVTVSKENSPAIHFVIHHKLMVQAFSNFIPPIVEN